MSSETIKIAGAGISGLTAGIILAKAGYKVKIYEKNNIVGKRSNKDCQGLMNWGFEEDVVDFMKRIGLEINFWNKPLKQIDIFGPNNYKQEFSLQRPFTYLVQRGTDYKCLDQSLKNQATNSGVEIIFNTIKNEEEVDIIATGPTFAKATWGMVLGYTFKSDNQDIYATIFDDEYAYNGYSYFVIADGHGTIATCIFGKYNYIQKYLEKTVSFIKKQYSFNIKNQKRFAGNANFYLLNSTKRYVGEAGGFQDYLWGYGIRYAITTGYLAAVSIIENKNYSTLWKNELNGLLKTSIANRFLFSALGKHSYQHVIKLFGKNNDIAASLTKAYQPNIFSHITYPVAKLYFGKYIKDRTSK